MVRPLAILTFSLLLLASCRSLGKTPELSYGQVQAVTTGLTVAQILDAFGDPIGTQRRPNGTVQRMEYAALDAKQGRARLILTFDERGILTSKEFTGQVIRP